MTQLAQVIHYSVGNCSINTSSIDKPILDFEDFYLDLDIKYPNQFGFALGANPSYATSGFSVLLM